MSYVSNNCWGFRRAEAQASFTCFRPVLPKPVVHGLSRSSKRNTDRSHSVHSKRRCSHRQCGRNISAAASSEKVRRGRAPSNPQTVAPDDGAGRLADFPIPPVIPAPQLEIPDPDDDGEEAGLHYADEDIRSRGGYTPFESLQFSNEDIMHELTVHVAAPRSKCFQIWEDRANYLEWFDNIYQLIVHKEEPDAVSLFIFYQWGTTPMLELYTTLGRSEFEENELIVEENIDGMDIVAGVIFADSETGSGTDVTFRMGYYLPEQLVEFVGPVAIYGDVNDILETSMARMKEFVETTDLEQLQASRKAEREEAEREQEERKKKFYKEHGSDEEIYRKAQEAAADYLAELGVEDEEEGEEEQEGEEEEDQDDENWDEEEEEEDEEGDVAAEYDSENYDEFSSEAQEDVDISPQDFILSESALSSHPSSSEQPQQLESQDELPEPVASTSGRATASEQQAAANMSSRHQQDLGQSDSAQASRVGPQDLLSSVSQLEEASEQEAPLDIELATVPQAALQSDETGDGQKKKKLGRPKTTKPAAELKPKNPGKPGRPRKSQTAAAKQT